VSGLRVKKEDSHIVGGEITGLRLDVGKLDSILLFISPRG
jgi:hypothetical protein